MAATSEMVMEEGVNVNNAVVKLTITMLDIIIFDNVGVPGGGCILALINPQISEDCKDRQRKEIAELAGRLHYCSGRVL